MTAVSQIADQAARHERWWVLQHELYPPLRELDPLEQLRRDVGDPGLVHRLCLHVRANGEGQARRTLPVFAVMFIVWLAMATIAVTAFETNGNPQIAAVRRESAAPYTRPAGTWREGGPHRPPCVRGLWAAQHHRHIERVRSTRMHDSMTALGGGSASEPHDARRGEPRWCGRGTERPAHDGDPVGVHRRPGAIAGYLGKKSQAPRRTWFVLYVGDARRQCWASPWPRCSSPRCGAPPIWNPGQHGFTEILNAFTSYLLLLPADVNA